MTTDPMPRVPPEKPPVVTWFFRYCWLLVVVYLAVAAFSLVFFVAEPTELEVSRAEALFAGGVILIIGLVFMVAALLPLVLRPQPWVWIYDLVIICLGLTSACTLPFCIPLLIFWIKPEAKSYFGRA